MAKKKDEKRVEDTPPRPMRGLGFQLVANFLSFGLFLGALLYAFTTLVDVRSLLRELGGYVWTEIFDDGKEGAASTPQAPKLGHDQRLEKTLLTLREKFPSDRNAMEILLYQKGSDSTWTSLTPVGMGVVQSAPVDPVTVERIRAVFPERKGWKTEWKEASWEVMVELPARESSRAWIVHTVIHRASIWHRIVEDRDLLIGYGLLMTIVSIVMGTFLSGGIVHPLNEITEAALRFGQGDYTYRNKVKRFDELGFLGRTLNYMAEKVKRNIDQIEYHARTMEAMNRIDKTVLGSLFDPKVVDFVAEIVAGFLGTGTVILAIPDDEAGVYRLSVYRSPSAGTRAAPPSEIPFAALPEGKRLDARGFEEFRLENPAGIPDEIRPFAFGEKGTLLHAPLVGSTGTQGSCFVVDEAKAGYSPAEREALRMLADQVGVAIQNARIYREKEALLLEILLSLTRAIDAKSRWTGGHSGRVAEYAVGLGKVQGLTSAELEALRMTGHLHDVGKLGTPESILDKPGALTPEEYAVIQKHPEDGARIVGPVDASKRFVAGILHHHERWDGKGYPAKLSGEDIPLMARILCIADVWDAISADRPYRAGMPLEKAISFMESNSGTLFDPTLLGLFLAEVKRGAFNEEPKQGA